MKVIWIVIPGYNRGATIGGMLLLQGEIRLYGDGWVAYSGFFFRFLFGGFRLIVHHRVLHRRRYGTRSVQVSIWE
ncbi:hypothetical protein F4778DRAFT_753842 [Xylariomycetidae sp. FL2044]|nr:hypothetical protein F4778DRAFT_753842 [Xylariomycetidae sp. FL2044]